jgi:hypothetical protein
VTRRLLCEALTVGDLAVTVCEVLAANGETYELKPRAVGEALRSLGLSTEKLGNEGRGLRLYTAAIADKRTAMSDTAGNYSVPSLPPANYEVRIQARGLTPAVIHGVPVGLNETAYRKCRDVGGLFGRQGVEGKGARQCTFSFKVWSAGGGLSMCRRRG